MDNFSTTTFPAARRVISATSGARRIVVVTAGTFEVTGDGWVRGAVPASPGVYERLTSHLGVRLDRWDGAMWVRRSRKDEQKYPGYGVACANQSWPWRPLQDHPTRGGGN